MIYLVALLCSISDLNVGTKQKMGNATTFTPFPNAYEKSLTAAVSRVTVQKFDDYDVLDSVNAHGPSDADFEMDDSVGSPDALAGAGAGVGTPKYHRPDDFNDESTLNDDSTAPTLRSHDPDKPFGISPLHHGEQRHSKKPALRVSKLGLVFHDPVESAEGGTGGTRGQRNIDAVIERTESYAGISTYFSKETRPVVVRTRPVPQVKKLVRKQPVGYDPNQKPKEEEEEDDGFVIDLEESKDSLESEHPIGVESEHEIMSMLEGMAPEEQEAYRVRLGTLLQ
jgi:hypothetical protein